MVLVLFLIGTLLNLLFNIFSGITPFNTSFSTTATGIFVIGSFKKFPVSSIAFVYTLFEFIFILILQSMSFLLNFPFMFLNAVVIIINPTIPPASTIFIGYVPINTPFFH